MIRTTIKTLSDLNISKTAQPGKTWQLRAVQSEDCLSYIIWNTETREGLIVDPKLEDKRAYSKIIAKLSRIRWLAVVDTHTHADHVSAAADLSLKLKVPLIMHQNAPSKRVDLRVCKNTTLKTNTGPLSFILSPGHTPDSMTVLWGPFVFGGDTLLFNDVGRDDLPGGDPEAHYESLQELKKIIPLKTILLAGHDNKGGQASVWKDQLKNNVSLKESKEEYIRGALDFNGAAPLKLNASLRENFK